MQFLLGLIFFELLISTKSDAIHSAQVQSNCKCSFGDLAGLEKLNSDLKRLRIEMPSGISKYSNSFLSYNSFFDCYSISIYENNDLDLKLCRKCLPSTGWSSLHKCESLKCDLDSLNGQFTLRPLNSNYQILNDQNLFHANQILAIYHQENTDVCRLCLPDGTWSPTPSKTFCQPMNTFSDCSYQTLRQIEYQNFDFIRIRIESNDGLRKIDEKSIRDHKLPSQTVVLYQKYLSSLNIPMRRRMGKFSANYFNPFTKKFCRYCNNGAWSDIESCVHLSCDREQLTGNPELLFLKNDRQLRSRSFYPEQNQVLYKANSVIAVYSYGSDKFCKLCHENGEWSKYSLNELCKTNNHSSLSNANNIYEDIYRKEAKCSLEKLKKIEFDDKFYFARNVSRLYFVSPDRKQKFLPDETQSDALLPSRTLCLYKNESDSLRFCSQCINGEWTQIGQDCTRTSLDLNFCERELLMPQNFTSIMLNMNEKIDDSQKYQTLFQPGRVMITYKQSERLTLCKICEQNAEWSKYALSENCAFNMAFKALNKSEISFQNAYLAPCKLNDLESSENKSYIRESVQNPSANLYLADRDQIKDGSMAVYKTDNNQADLRRISIKYCRRCSNGTWELKISPCPIEFAIRKCDPTKLRGVNYFVYVSDGAQLSDEESRYLMMPGKVMAVYEFGMQKYCKGCNEDGAWSSYPQYQLCNLVNWTK